MKRKLTLKLVTKIRFVNGLIAVVIMVGIGVVGAYFVASSHAATPYSTTEAESGTLSGAATATTDNTASGGSAVQFGSSPLVAHIVDGQLMDAKNQPLRLLGVDVTGTESACIEDKGFSWIPTDISDATEAATIASWHINAVRVPLNEDCWLGINGAPTAYSGQNYQTYINNWVKALNNAGIYTILDLHWAAPGTYSANQQWPMADADHSGTFWSQVASDYSSDPGVIYDPFNEPFIGYTTPTASNWACWLNGCNASFDTTSNDPSTLVEYTTAGMQQLVDAIRGTGANQPIMVGGLNWAGDPCGLKDSGGNGGVCMETATMPNDPDHQLAISFHTYSWTACATTTCWNTVNQAARAASLPLITGEFGEDDCSANYDNSYMNWADQNNVSYLAWAWETLGNYGTTCIGTTTGNGSNVPGSYMNLELLSNWDGLPNPVAPQGENYKTHLAQINP